MQAVPTGGAKTERYGITVADPSSFTTLRVGRIQHNYGEHPMMQLPALAELAREMMPTGGCRFIRPGTTQGSEFWHDPTSPDGRTIEQVFQDIEQPGSWVALYNVEKVPRYRQFLTEIIDSVRAYIERDQRRIFLITGFIFISAPPSVTPFHIDRENNFWLQVHGRKVINVWDHTDRSIVPARDVEDFIVNRSLRNVRLKDGFTERGMEFDVGPGDGVYFPSTTPHMTRSDRGWVKPGDGFSLSIGVNFYTELTRRHARAHQANKLLRRLGLTPSDPGTSTWRDSLKSPIGRAFGAARYLLRREKAPPGAY